LFRSEQDVVALSISKTITNKEVLQRASQHFETEFNAISVSDVKLDLGGSFVDFFEPEAVYVLHVGPKVAAGTLLAGSLDELRSISIEVKSAELLLAKGEGPWDFREFEEKVVGQAPLVVLVESELGICGGLAAVPFLDKEWEVVADPSGATRVFSIKPTARYPLEDKAKALYLGPGCFEFYGCLGILDCGEMGRNESTYAVPSGWETGIPCPKFTRFEIWRALLTRTA
jgi:hypothetical protein